MLHKSTSSRCSWTGFVPKCGDHPGSLYAPASFFSLEQWAQLQGAGARFVLSRTGQGQCLATSQNCIGAGDKLPVAHQYSKQTVTPLHHSPAAVWTAMQLTAGSHQDSPALLVGNVAWQRNMALHQGPPKALGLPLDMAGTLVPAAGAGTGQV